MSIHNRELFESQSDLLQGNLQIIACAGSGKTEFILTLPDTFTDFVEFFIQYHLIEEMKKLF